MLRVAGGVGRALFLPFGRVKAYPALAFRIASKPFDLRDLL